MTDRSANPTAPSGPAETGPSGADGLVLPHRGRAILRFGFVALGCCGLTALIAVALGAGWILAESSEGTILLYLGALAMAAYLILAAVAWAMASRDLRLMAAGRVDPAGRARTRSGRMIAEVLTVATVVFALGLAILFLKTFRV